jgi:hypothetical protein
LDSSPAQEKAQC